VLKGVIRSKYCATIQSEHGKQTWEQSILKNGKIKFHKSGEINVVDVPPEISSTKRNYCALRCDLEKISCGFSTTSSRGILLMFKRAAASSP
jgi:hypothetical protein